MRISDWSSDVCSSDLHGPTGDRRGERRGRSQVHPHGRPHILVDGSGRTQWYLDRAGYRRGDKGSRSEEHTSELQSLMRISYAVFCLQKKKSKQHIHHTLYKGEQKRLTPKTKS